MVALCDPSELGPRAVALGAVLRDRALVLVTAESCTGGWIAKLITDVPGSSQWFDRGFVTYSNDAKTEMLSVPETHFEHFGAVSAEVAEAMAFGALVASEAEVAIAVTGVAGPDGGSPDKPVGTVWLAWAGPWGCDTELMRFDGDRDAVRCQSVRVALDGMIARLAPE